MAMAEHEVETADEDELDKSSERLGELCFRLWPP